MQTFIVGAGLTATTNPNPNTLTTKSPYNSRQVTDVLVPSAAWNSQGAHGVITKFEPAYDVRQMLELDFYFIPSVANASFSIKLWVYEFISGDWLELANSGSATYANISTGVQDWIKLTAGIKSRPIFFQIVSLSSGTLSILSNSSMAQIL